MVNNKDVYINDDDDDEMYFLVEQQHAAGEHLQAQSLLVQVYRRVRRLRRIAGDRAAGHRSTGAGR